MAALKFPFWGTDSTPLVNGDANKEDPGVVKQVQGWVIEKPKVGYMNWWQNLVGHYVTANNEIKEKSSLYIASAGEHVLLDNTSSSVFGFLPADPVDGQWVDFGGKVAYTNYGVNINGNGKDIMVVGTTSIQLDIDNQMFRFHFRATDNMWMISQSNLVGAV